MANQPLPDFRETNREAGEILSQNSNRLKLIEGIFVCVTFFIFALLLREACLQAAQLMATQLGKILFFIAGNLLYCGVVLLAVMPLVVGLFGMAARMANDCDVFLPDLFLPFASGKNYLRALIVLWPLYWKFGVFCWFPGLAFDALVSYFGKTLLLVILGAVVLGLLIVVWLLLGLRGFVRLSFLLQWRMPLLAAGRANRQIAGKSFAGGGRWWLCFLPRILLGFATVGILLVADVIPRMLISYFRYAGRMTDFVFSSEEPNHE